MFEHHFSVGNSVISTAWRTSSRELLWGGQNGPLVIRKSNVNKLFKSCPCQPWRKFSYLFVTCSKVEGLPKKFLLNFLAKPFPSSL